MKIKTLKPTIGLEVHIELKTNSKMFCGCPSDHFGKTPNTQTCPVCLGLPGALPVPNKKAIDWTIMLGLSLNSKINKFSKFDRKHYFYPDLAKGYQISQYDEPLCLGGYLETNEGTFNITRVHLEEDTGKLQHRNIDGEELTLIDFNRSGVALVEIVSEPEIRSGIQAKEYARELQRIVRYLGISNCDMEKGSMRLEANISWGLHLGYKVEVKNLNSFRFVEKAINYELDRQKKLLDGGEIPKQETRGWNETKNITFRQRVKETSADYRYFPEPDIPPMEFSDIQIKNIGLQIPELPIKKRKRFIKEFGLPFNYSDILTLDRKKADFYEKAFVLSKKEDIEAKTLASLIINKSLKAETPQMLVNAAKILRSKEFLGQNEIEKAVKEVLVKQAGAVSDYKSGKTKVLGFLIGMVQKSLEGKGDYSDINKILLKLLK